jgi:hypothetical protein
VERNPVLIFALAFVVLLGTLTVGAAIETGPSILTVLSLIILGLIATGIVSALREPYD